MFRKGKYKALQLILKKKTKVERQRSFRNVWTQISFEYQKLIKLATLHYKVNEKKIHQINEYMPGDQRGSKM